MKIKSIIWLISITILCVLALYSGISHSTVVGSKHDLSASGEALFTFDTEQVCVFCHTPHKAKYNTDTYQKTDITPSTIHNGSEFPAGVAGFYNSSTYKVVNAAIASPSLLLWNRELSNQTTYSTYTSSTLDVKTSEIRIYSLLCLSCHDGINALNVLFNNPSEVWEGVPPSMEPSGGSTRFADEYWGDQVFGWGPNIGERVVSGDTLNLSNDHPISFDYPEDSSHPDVESGSLRASGSGACGVGCVNHPSVRLFPNPLNFKLNSMECSTCHDVHNEGLDEFGVDTGLAPFLVMTKVGSGLCINCHIK